MKTKMKNFNVILLSMLCITPLVGRAAVTDYDDIDCEAFNPAFALCSTHAHNVGFKSTETGLPANPVNAEDIAYMNEVIAMKTTVIVQQLKQQYDSLDAVIKRFKTQLEKAVLTSKLEVLTGNTSSSNSGGGSRASASAGNRLANAENCDSYTGVNVHDCLVRNLNKISAALDNDTQNARKQLENDIGIADDFQMCNENKEKCTEFIDDCNDIRNAYKDTLKKCVTSLSRQISRARTAYEREDARARSGWH